MPNFVVIGSNTSVNPPTPVVTPTATITVAAGVEVNETLTITDTLGQSPTVNAPFGLSQIGTTDQFTLTSTGLTEDDTVTIDADSLWADPLSQAITVDVTGSVITATTPINISTGSTVSTVITVTNRGGNDPTVNAPFTLTQIGATDQYTLTSSALTADDTATISINNGTDPVETFDVNVIVSAVVAGVSGSYRGGWTLQLHDGLAYNTQLKITDISGLSVEAPTLRVTCFDSSSEQYIAGFRDGAELNITAHLLLEDAEQRAYLDRIDAGEKGLVRVITNDGTTTLTLDFEVLYTAWEISPAYEDVNNVNMKLKINSPITRGYV